MKKITFICAAAALLSLAACKKDYACTCTSTTHYSNGDTDADGPTITTLRGVHKGQAKGQCLDYDRTGAASGSVTYTTTVDCDLSKK